MSIKPVAKLRNTSRGWAIHSVHREICAMPNGERDLYAIPDTHRVVSVELLRKAMSEDLSIPGLYDELRAIIEDKP